ncbi:helix-turn-helix domain-containing protein [Nonomuraea rhodomycinica]|uniref:MerR family transcriptional regulator n=1 Tax=Nonomuraea rhodomycinica TaxID=1712872 RepID=A0A7Y6IN63_9ACTN|nr:helix-turn-helix domain-containing protein [Nonomuraea rhodomycinica]NUW39984.1 MerR family transcriptional regulator [Nonomuraea rhodomycinica]
MEETWTIGELAERAAGLLRAGGPNGNGRVREVPGERLIRWYTTIGLVDPPLSRRGRVARYGRRHLLQLVAVKRLQAAGLSIADIQVALAGATDAMLEGAAHPETDPARPQDAAPEDAPDRFWARAPRGRAPSPAAPRPGGHDEPRLRGPGAAPEPAPPGGLVRGIRLAPGVTLVLDGSGRVPSTDDVQAVLGAAAPLLAVLEERKLA